MSDKHNKKKNAAESEEEELTGGGENLSAEQQSEDVLPAEEHPEEELPKAEPQPEKKEPTELEKAQALAEDYKRKWYSVSAEYDNYRKRTDREKAAIYNDAKSDTIEKILPVADNLERALEQKDCTAEDLRKGVEMVQKQFLDAMEKLGIESMGEAGEPFNPDLHNAVAHIDSDELGENVIAAVFQKGYKIGDKVIRHAMVQVAN